MTLLRKVNGNKEWDRLFNHVMGGDFYTSPSGFHSGHNNLPAVNIQEVEDDFKIEVAIPGMKKSDIKIELNQNVLTISASKDDDADAGSFSKREFNYNNFERSFAMPKGKIEDGKISAKYEDGILFLVLPKKEEAKPRPIRAISIN